MRFAYVGALLVSAAGVALVDRRWRLFVWQDARRAAIVLVSGVVVLLAADAVGIANGLFFRAPTRVMTGVLLAPELPLEEPVFLAFLCYLAMVLVTGSERLVAAARARGRARRAGRAHVARSAHDEHSAPLHAGGRP